MCDVLMCGLLRVFLKGWKRWSYPGIYGQKVDAAETLNLLARVVDFGLGACACCACKIQRNVALVVGATTSC